MKIILTNQLFFVQLMWEFFTEMHNSNILTFEEFQKNHIDKVSLEEVPQLHTSHSSKQNHAYNSASTHTLHAGNRFASPQSAERSDQPGSVSLSSHTQRRGDLNTARTPPSLHAHCSPTKTKSYELSPRLNTHTHTYLKNIGINYALTPSKTFLLSK